MSRNSMTARRAASAASLLTFTTMPSLTVIVQEGCGFGIH
jgi:hypothetical protein